MRSFTFSLSSLLGIITLLSLDFGAVVADSRVMTSMAYTVFFALICFSVAAGLVAPGERRPFWIGFASFAVFYWVAVFESPPTAHRNPYASLGISGVGAIESSSRNIITSDVLDYLEDRLVMRHRVGDHAFARWQGGGYYWGTILELGDDGRYLIKWDDGSTPTWQTRADMASVSGHRRVAMHCTVATLWAFLGGALVAYWVARVSQKSTVTAGTATSGAATGP